jgi:hypothetical protein
LTFTQALDQSVLQRTSVLELQKKIEIITKETEINRNLLIKKYTADLEDLNLKYLSVVEELQASQNQAKDLNMNIEYLRKQQEE